MVIISSNFIKEKEAEEFITFADFNIGLFTHTEDKYWYNGISILKQKDNFSFFNRLNIQQYNPELLRIHKIDSSFNTPEVSHFDPAPFSFIIFLNENYTGGELNFKAVKITPIQYSVAYFTKEESHYINKVISGVRYTLVGFLNTPLSFDRKTSLL